MHMRDYINLILEAMSDMSLADANKVFAQYGVPNASSLSPEDLKDARKRLIMQHHQDRGGDHDAGAWINSAYDTLKKAGQSNKSYRDPDEFAPWAQAGYSGGLPNSSRISRQDYRDMNFIKKRMWELSNHSREEWTIYGFDGAFLRGTLTVYGSSTIFAEMARAMVIWQTKGGNPYACRAVLVNKRNSRKYYVIWADDRFFDKQPIPIESDSFNANPENDRTFDGRLRELLDQIDENNGPLLDQSQGWI